MVELMIVVAIIGILAAIAVPNFIKFQARAKQSEAKTNLKAMYVAETGYFAVHDTYSSAILEIGFAPERGNRYAYALGSGAYQARSASTLGSAASAVVGIEVDSWKIAGATPQPTPSATNFTLQPLSGGVTPTSPPGVATGQSGSFAATATGTIDTDPEFDSWIICGNMTLQLSASACSEAGGFPPGIAANNYDDVACP